MNYNKILKSDLIVVGGGLAGLTLTALLAGRGINVICIDREDPEATLDKRFDGRTTAISYGSRQIMDAANIWGHIAQDACPIKTIHILDNGSPVLLDFSSAEVNSDAFGWIIENRILRRALYKRVSQIKAARHLTPVVVKDFSVDERSARVHLADGRICAAPLVVGADGRGSFTREWMGIGARQWSYRQRAVVCSVTHEQPHNDIAIEDFRPDGPFAILPMTDDPQGRARSSVVWTEHGNSRDSALQYDRQVFNAALQSRFPESYGAVSLIEQRFSYPLGLIHAHDYIAPRMALVADAAHGIHPIAGQGLNIGLRDIAVIADIVYTALQAGKDPGNPQLLAAYQRQRRADNMAMAGATDILNRLFSNNIGPLRILRRTGLKIVGRVPPAKTFFMRQAMGSTGILPDIIRDAKAA